MNPVRGGRANGRTSEINECKLCMFKWVNLDDKIVFDCTGCLNKHT